MNITKKKKITGKAFALLLSLTMVVTMTPAIAFAEDDYEAQIGVRKYNKLQDAILDAKDGDDIIVLKDNITPEETFKFSYLDREIEVTSEGLYSFAMKGINREEGQDIYTIDASGHTVNGGIVDGLRGKIIPEEQEGPEDSSNKTIIIKGGVFSAGDNSAVFLMNSGTTMVINDGKYTSELQPAVLQYKGTTMIDGGSFDGPFAVLNYGGTTTINGGTFNGSYGSIGAAPMDTEAKININGGCFYGPIVTQSGGEMNITGGTFIGDINDGSDLAEEFGQPDMKGTISISGGNFSVDPTRFLVEGHTVTQVGDRWIVDYGAETNVAQIGDTKYTTLAYAIAAVQNGGTIEMLCNVEGAHGISVPSGKNFTVDFKNHTYSVEKPGAGSSGTKTQAFQLLKGSNITFKNGTISCTAANKDSTWTSDAAEKGVAMIIQNYADLTLDNMTIDASNIAHNGNNVRYAVSNNNGTTTIKNSTINTAANDFAFDSYYKGEQNYSTPTVNVEKSTINGKVEATGGKINIKTGTTVNGQLRVGENKNGTTVENSVVTIEAGATVQKDEYPVVVFGRNTLNVYGTVKSTSTDSNDTAAIATNGNKYNGGSVINIYNGADISAAKCNGIYMPNGTLNITGGTITGETAVYFKSTNLNISGGNLEATGDAVAYNYNGNGGDATGDTLVIDNCNYPNGIQQISITGGSFESANGKQVGYYEKNATAIANATSSLDLSLTTGYEWKDHQLAKCTSSQNIEEVTESNVEQLLTEGSDKNEDAKTMVVETVTNNNAVNNFANSNIEKAVEKTESATSAIKALLKAEGSAQGTDAQNEIDQLTNSDFVDYVKVTTESATVANYTVQATTGAANKTTVTTMKFNIKPMIEVTVGSGDNSKKLTTVIPNELIKEPITFRLPIESSVPVGTIVNVFHSDVDSNDKGDPFGKYRVQVENGKKFIELASDHFSYFTYELTEDVVGTATYSATLNLADSIGILFYISNPTGTLNKYEVTATYKGKTTTTQLDESKATDTANKYCIKIADCAAAEMFEKVHVVVSYDGINIKEFNYSVYDYCNSKINETGTADNLKELCTAALDYGSYAKPFFNYTEMNVVEGSYVARIVDGVTPETDISASKSGLCSGITAVSATLSLESKTKIIFYLKTEGEANKDSFTYSFSGGGIENATPEVSVAADGRIQVEAAGIAASKLGEAYTLTVTPNGEGTTPMTVTYSPMTYAKAKYTSSTPGLPNLVKSLYQYYLAANAFFA